MKHVLKFIGGSFLAGLVIVAPIYLTVLLLLKAIHTVADLVRPFAKVLPKWFPGEDVLAPLMVLIFCFIIGVAVRTQPGQAVRKRIEQSFERIPGYAVFRSLTQQLAGSKEERAWKPALAEIEEALVPAFIIEEFEDGRFTVFVPSAPTPVTGSIYILTPERVHPVDIPFTRAIRSLAQWGAGSKELASGVKSPKAA
jgi:uncharacterized membrane protein